MNMNFLVVRMVSIDKTNPDVAGVLYHGTDAQGDLRIAEFETAWRAKLVRDNMQEEFPDNRYEVLNLATARIVE